MNISIRKISHFYLDQKNDSATHQIIILGSKIKRRISFITISHFQTTFSVSDYWNNRLTFSVERKEDRKEKLSVWIKRVAKRTTILWRYLSLFSEVLDEMENALFLEMCTEKGFINLTFRLGENSLKMMSSLEIR